MDVVTPPYEGVFDDDVCNFDFGILASDNAFPDSEHKNWNTEYDVNDETENPNSNSKTSPAYSAADFEPMDSPLSPLGDFHCGMNSSLADNLLLGGADHVATSIVGNNLVPPDEDRGDSSPIDSSFCPKKTLPENDGVSSVSSGTGRPRVKIVKVIRPRDSHDSTTDVLKAIDEKNRKNALLARNNRAKKKQYVEDLEKQVKELSQSNACLEEKVEEMNKKIEELMADREHMKSVIVNASALAGLLQNIQGVKFRADLGSRKRGSEAVDDHDHSSPPKKSRKSSCAGGVCLHVTSEQITLEFCSQCAQKSAQVD